MVGKKGERVFTGSDDERAISLGVYETYQKANLRYSQLAPLSTFDEVNTKNNLPAQVEIFSTEGDAYKVPLHGERRRLGQQELPVPRDEGPPEPRAPDGVLGREDEGPRHGRLPTLSPSPS